MVWPRAGPAMSGWHFFCNQRYDRRISWGLALLSTPSTSYKSTTVSSSLLPTDDDVDDVDAARIFTFLLRLVNDDAVKAV